MALVMSQSDWILSREDVFLCFSFGGRLEGPRGPGSHIGGPGSKGLQWDDLGWLLATLQLCMVCVFLGFFRSDCRISKNCFSWKVMFKVIF